MEFSILLRLVCDEPHTDSFKVTVNKSKTSVLIFLQSSGSMKFSMLLKPVGLC